MQDESLKKQVVLYKVDAIDNLDTITIAVNPKEYLEKYRDKEINKKHKGVRKGTPSIDFDIYSRRILSLNNHETINKIP